MDYEKYLIFLKGNCEQSSCFRLFVDLFRSNLPTAMLCSSRFSLYHAIIILHLVLSSLD